jgi:hypothetical protein
VVEREDASPLGTYREDPVGTAVVTGTVVPGEAADAAPPASAG